MADTRALGPLNIRVISDEEAEQCAYVVCAPAEQASLFADDVLTTCAACTRPIRHRPHVPSRPPKVCMSCVMALTNPGKLN